MDAIKISTVCSSLWLVIFGIMPICTGVFYTLMKQAHDTRKYKIIAYRIVILSYMISYKVFKKTRILNILRLLFTNKEHEVYIASSSKNYIISTNCSTYQSERCFNHFNINISLFNSELSECGVLADEYTGLKWILNVMLSKRKFLV